MKLDIGCGDFLREGYTQVDRKHGLEAYPLAFEDNTADEIIASHILEHFPFLQSENVLKDWVRVLKPSGLIQIAVPNFQWILANQGHPLFEALIYGGCTDDNDYHGALFTDKKLRRLMIRAGITNIEPWTSTQKDCSALDCSLNLQGTKEAAFAAEPKIEMFCSKPRYGPLLTTDCAAIAAICNGLKWRKATGVYWHEVMQNTFEDMISDGTDIVLTYDYDSAFEPHDVALLIKTMKEHPEIDALAGMQPQRGSGELMALVDGDKNQLAIESLGKPFKVHTAHFGLTAIRLSRLKDIPKPWFYCQPGEGGSYRHGAKGFMHADIFFWHQWEHFGRSLYTLGAVTLGHGEQGVWKYDWKTGTAKFYFADEWKEGNPLELAEKQHADRRA